LNTKVWSDKAIDYASGIVIYDPVSLVEYSEVEAGLLSVEVKCRLCCRGVKLGCFVLSLEECHRLVLERA